MFFYLFIFFLSVLFIYFANRSKHPFFFILLAFLVPSVIGGFRDLTVGTDVMGYGVDFFDFSLSFNSVDELLKEWHNKEYAYILLNYFSSRISDNIQLFLFLLELIKMVLVTYTVWYFRRIVNPIFVFAAYMLFFYCSGLSMLRQSIALCVCIYSLIFFFEKKYFKFLICVLIAYLFHNSALFFLYFPFIHFISLKLKHSVWIILIGCIIAYFLSSNLFFILDKIGVLRSDLVELYYDSGVTLAKSNILLAFGILFMLYSIPYKYLTISPYYVIMIKNLCIICLLFLFLSNFFEVAFRASYYQIIVLIFIVPYYLNSINNIRLKKSCYLGYMLLHLINYFAHAVHNSGIVFPYSSEILGI